jgi:NADPH-dependent 2,4-dienoyl-CoA reductase/sulfur reductase-like enzyme/nitrite reductase/ring-hydroxylating ferredoxin subunit
MANSPSDDARGPDLTQGIASSVIPSQGVFKGHVGDSPVLLARVDGALVAISGACSHYGAPLDEGLRVGDTLNCPWHHACFDLRTGAAVKAPALSPLARWEVEERDGVVRVGKPLSTATAPVREAAADPGSIVIVGAGAAGFAAAQQLRDLGFRNDLTLISEDPAAPYDRPNVSKDYLAGTADPAWMPLKDDAFYRDNKIALRTSTRVEAVNAQARRIALSGGEAVGYDSLLLTTGAEPNRPATPGFDLDNVFVLRTLRDSDQVIARATSGSSVAVVGSSFIGLEAAASLRTRGLAVHVIGREAIPLAGKLGPAVGNLVRSLHERHGVQFHLGRTVSSFDGARVLLDDGNTLGVDMVVLGLGVTPRLDLAKSAGLTLSNGVVVNTSMRTSDPRIFAAGDIARFPNPLGGAAIRVEHWVLAQRLGQVAAHGMLGIQNALREPPFFWSAHYDLTIRYVGHANTWDSIEEVGSVADADAEVRYIKDGRLAAVATLNRDLASLRAAQALTEQASR